MYVKLRCMFQLRNTIYSNCRYDFDPEQFAGSAVPMLVIGTKLDLSETVRDTKPQRSSSSISDEVGADEISVVCFLFVSCSFY